VRVPCPLPIPVDTTLHVGGPGPYPRDRVGDRTARVVVEVHADLALEIGHDAAHDALHVVGQRAAVGVAQHDRLGTRLLCGAHDAQGELRIVAVSVEEVLGV